MGDPVTEHFNASELAAFCNLSTTQFYRLFRMEYGVTPLEYHNNFLLRKAERLLETPAIYRDGDRGNAGI